MRRQLVILSLACALLVACASSSVTQFWRPISEPNLLMEPDPLQQKLGFDLGQCHFSISDFGFQFEEKRLFTIPSQYQPTDSRITNGAEW